MKLWLDDVRPAPDETWTHAETAEEAIELIKTGRVTQVSLDHDLGIARKTGYDVACFIEAMAHTGQIPPIKKFAVHSANPVGRERMVQALRSARDAWEENDDHE